MCPQTLGVCKTLAQLPLDLRHSLVLWNNYQHGPTRPNTAPWGVFWCHRVHIQREAGFGSWGGPPSWGSQRLKGAQLRERAVLGETDGLRVLTKAKELQMMSQHSNHLKSMGVNQKQPDIGGERQIDDYCCSRTYKRFSRCTYSIKLPEVFVGGESYHWGKDFDC